MAECDEAAQIPDVIWVVTSPTGYPVAVGAMQGEARIWATRRKKEDWPSLRLRGYTCRRVRIVEIAE